MSESTRSGDGHVEDEGQGQRGDQGASGRGDADPVAHALALTNLAVVRHQYREALEHARRAYALQPDSPKVLRAMAFCHFLNGLHEDAERYARAACDRDSTPASLGMLGNLLLDMGKFADAEAAYRKMLDRDPNHPQALNGVATARYRQGDKQGAIAYYAKAFEAAPDDPAPLRSLGSVLADIGWHIGAYAASSMVVSEATPPAVQAVLALVRLDLAAALPESVRSSHLPDWRQAAAQVMERVAGRPPAVQLRAARSLFDVGETRWAKKVLERLDANTLSGPDRANYMYVKGILADARGDTREALDAFVAAVQLDERRWDACCNAVHILLERGDEEAMSLAGELLGRIPPAVKAEAPPLLFNEALYLRRTGHPDEARALLQRVLELTNGRGELGELARRALEEGSEKES